MARSSFWGKRCQSGALKNVEVWPAEEEVEEIRGANCIAKAAGKEGATFLEGELWLWRGPREETGAEERYQGTVQGDSAVRLFVSLSQV